jgi:PAS domain S-box-containing protein
LEELLNIFAARLTSSTPDQLHSVIENGLSDVLNLTKSGCVCWYEEDPNNRDLKLVLYSTDNPGLELLPSILTRNDLPYTFQVLSNGKSIILRSPHDLPPEANQDREFFRKRSIWNLIMTSSQYDTQRKGILAVAYLPEDIQLTDNLVAQLTVFNNLIGNGVERKRVYGLWHESEERFQWLFQNAPVGIAIEGLESNLLFVNPALCSMFGYSNRELLGMRFRDLSVPGSDEGDSLQFSRLQNGLVEHYRIEEQLIRKDGTSIWGRVDVAILNRRTKEVPLVIRMVEDITEHKYADDELLKTRTELEQLAGHLIQAQEEERHRISRELHDDIAQRVSLLAIEVESLTQSLANAGCDKELEGISGLKAEMDDLANDVHSLSHRLHSTRLQHLGLRSAVEELTKQVSKQHHISINVSTYGRDTLLPPDVALCLFRVTQEALNNAVRHSHAQAVYIELNVERGRARLQISDTGVGFDISGCESGIGLVNMRERLRMLGGEFSVQSREGEGTLITATVRFAEEMIDKVA